MFSRGMHREDRLSCPLHLGEVSMALLLVDVRIKFDHGAVGAKLSGNRKNANCFGSRQVKVSVHPSFNRHWVEQDIFKVDEALLKVICHPNFVMATVWLPSTIQSSDLIVVVNLQ